MENTSSNGGTSKDRYAHLRNTLGEDLFAKVQTAKVLVVGAGGIGCELLKNLVLSGWMDIEIIDMDTIDLSNLNRQFLFQRKHIGLPKSQVAKESAVRFNPEAKIIAHHGNIKESNFGPDFFKKFDLVMNALDNLDARRHVNRLCIATNIPLIESGTAGYLGQVQVIQREKTECYECQPKPTPKAYAYCTIRSNPTKPIHCIIWAKEEFKTNFGDPAAIIPEDEEKIVDDEIVKEEAALASKKDKGFAEWLFHKLFYTDIFKKVRIATLTAKDLWAGRDPPAPLSLEKLMALKDTTPKPTGEQLPDQVVWSVKKNVAQFITSVNRLKERFDKDGFLEFDKDDNDALDFVTCASNLRSHIFGIPIQSRFSIKSQAGNIIPAIATTNAIIAGLIVMEGFKLLQGQLKNCRMTYLQQKPSRGRLLLSTVPEQQNPNCYVCAANFLTVKVNTQTTTLGQFVDQVLKGKLAMNEPSVIVQSDIIYECGEGLEEDELAQMNKQLTKLLRDVRITHNTIVEADDNSQNFKLQISVQHSEKFEDETQNFEIIGKAQAQEAATAAQVAAARAALVAVATPATTDDGEDVMIVDKPANAPAISGKRKRPTDGQEEEKNSKKVKSGKEEANNGVIEL